VASCTECTLQNQRVEGQKIADVVRFLNETEMKVHFLIVDTSCDKPRIFLKVYVTKVPLLPSNLWRGLAFQAFIVWEHLPVLS